MTDDTCTADPTLVTPVKRGRGRPKKYKTAEEKSMDNIHACHRYYLKKKILEYDPSRLDARRAFLRERIEKCQKELEQLDVVELQLKKIT